METRIGYERIHHKIYNEPPEDGVDLKLDYIYDKLQLFSTVSIILRLTINDGPFCIDCKLRNVTEPLEGILCDLVLYRYDDESNEYMDETFSSYTALCRKNLFSDDTTEEIFMNTICEKINGLLELAVSDLDIELDKIEVEIAVADSIYCLVEVQNV